MMVKSLNIFRFMAAIIVINFHFTKLFPGFFTSGPEMVTFFFVLSGAVLILTYYEKEEFSSKEFFLKRIFKLYPSYIIALFIAQLIGSRSGATFNFFDTNLLLSLTAQQAWFPPHAVDLNFPAWAISVEAFFYLSFPIILYFLKKIQPNPFFTVILAFVFWLITQSIITPLLNSDFYEGYPSISHDLLFYFPLSHLCSFLLGVAIGYLAIIRDLEIPKGADFALFILSSIMIYSICEYKFMIYTVVGLRIPFDSSFLAPAFGFFILSNILISNSYLKNFLSNKLFLFLGASSYDLYIFQFPIYYLQHNILGISNSYTYLILDVIISVLIYVLLNSLRKNWSILSRKHT